MNTLTISKPANPGIWTKIWYGLRAFDEAIHHDPAEALHRRTESLEARLEDLERRQAK
jgi:hypothetical protein